MSTFRHNSRHTVHQRSLTPIRKTRLFFSQPFLTGHVVQKETLVGTVFLKQHLVLTLTCSHSSEPVYSPSNITHAEMIMFCTTVFLHKLAHTLDYFLTLAFYISFQVPAIRKLFIAKYFWTYKEFAVVYRCCKKNQYKVVMTIKEEVYIAIHKIMSSYNIIYVGIYSCQCIFARWCLQMRTC